MSARMKKTVHVRVIVSFDDVKKGDIAHLDLTPRVQAWINAGLVEVLDGESAAGPGGPDEGDDERVADGAEGSVPASGEQGEGFGAGAYGAFA